MGLLSSLINVFFIRNFVAGGVFLATRRFKIENICYEGDPGARSPEDFFNCE